MLSVFKVKGHTYLNKHAAETKLQVCLSLCGFVVDTKHQKVDNKDTRAASVDLTGFSFFIVFLRYNKQKYIFKIRGVFRTQSDI